MIATAPLMPLIEYKTDIPVPFDSLKTTAPKDDKQRINVSVCSELYQLPTYSSSVDVREKAEILMDADEQPVILSISDDKRLILLAHVNEGPVAWQRVDISPVAASDDYGVNTFAVLQVTDQKAAVVVSVQSKVDQTCDLYYLDWTLPHLRWNDNENRISNVGIAPNSWKKCANNRGALKVTTVAITSWIDRNEASSEPESHIIVGTEQNATKAGYHYTLNPNDREPFRPFSMAGTAETVMQVIPGSLFPGMGAFSLFRQPGSGSDSNDGPFACQFDSLLGGVHYSIQVQDLGRLTSITSNLNPAKYTDLFVAAEKGLAFYNYKSIDAAPRILLPQESFRSVSCSEREIDDQQSKLVIFAISTQDSLYYLEGFRSLRTGDVTFNASGLPIRADVAWTSAQYNPSNAAELILFDNNQVSELVHLWKDKDDGLWHRQEIRHQNPGSKPVRRATWATTVTIKSSNGYPLSEYPCSLTSDYSFVTVDNRTRILDSKPWQTQTDENGQITIFKECQSGLSPSSYLLEVPSLNPEVVSFVKTIEPASRLIRGMTTITDVDDIKNAKNINGESVFKKLSATDEELAVVARLTSTSHSLYTSINKDRAREIYGEDVGDSDMSEGFTVDASGNFAAVNPKDAEDDEDGDEKTETSWISDVLESIRSKVKQAFRVVIRAFGKVVKFWIKIAGKVFVFSVKSFPVVTRVLVTFVGDILGVDLRRLCDWFSFALDLEKTKQTQKVLAECVQNSLVTAKTFVKVNKEVVIRLIAKLRRWLSQYIKDSRLPVESNKDRAPVPFSNPLDFIMNNPVISFIRRYSLLGILTEVISEELGDSFQLPDMSSLQQIMEETLPTLVQDQIDNIMRFVKSFVPKIKDLFSGDLNFMDFLIQVFSDNFWTIFDGVEILIGALFDVMSKVLDALSNILLGKWVLPVVSEVWNELTDGMDLSIVNVLTLGVAAIWNIFSLTTTGKLPFEEDSDFAKAFLFSDAELSLASVFDVAMEDKAAVPPRKPAVRRTRVAGLDGSPEPRNTNKPAPNPAPAKPPVVAPANLSEKDGAPQPVAVANVTGDDDNKKALKRNYKIFKIVDMSISIVGRITSCGGSIYELGEAMSALEVPEPKEKMGDILDPDPNIKAWNLKMQHKIDLRKKAHKAGEAIHRPGIGWFLDTLHASISLGSVINTSVMLIRGSADDYTTALGIADKQRVVDSRIGFVTVKAFRVACHGIALLLRLASSKSETFSKHFLLANQIFHIFPFFVDTIVCDLVLDLRMQTDEELAKPASKFGIAAGAMEIAASTACCAGMVMSRIETLEPYAWGALIADGGFCIFGSGCVAAAIAFTVKDGDGDDKNGDDNAAEDGKVPTTTVLGSANEVSEKKKRD